MGVCAAAAAAAAAVATAACASVKGDVEAARGCACGFGGGERGGT